MQIDQHEGLAVPSECGRCEGELASLSEVEKKQLKSLWSLCDKLDPHYKAKKGDNPELPQDGQVRNPESLLELFEQEKEHMKRRE